jgi:hypothetical protein
MHGATAGAQGGLGAHSTLLSQEQASGRMKSNAAGQLESVCASYAEINYWDDMTPMFIRIYLSVAEYSLFKVALS